MNKIQFFSQTAWLGNFTCPAGSIGQGGRCDCRWAPGWNQFDWKHECIDGICYASQDYPLCYGKDPWHPVGDGTVCYENKRYTYCYTITGITTPGNKNIIA